MQFPEMSDALIEPFKFQGVYGYDDIGVIVRGKFMAKAGQQFGVRKEILNRVRREFEENGIEFARKEVRVHVPDVDSNTDFDPTQKEAIAAAASQAAEKELANPSRLWHQSFPLVGASPTSSAMPSMSPMRQKRQSSGSRLGSLVKNLSDLYRHAVLVDLTIASKSATRAGSGPEGSGEGRNHRQSKGSMLLS